MKDRDMETIADASTRDTPAAPTTPRIAVTVIGTHLVMDYGSEERARAAMESGAWLDDLDAIEAEARSTPAEALPLGARTDETAIAATLDMDFAVLAMTDQPALPVEDDGYHEHTGVPCRTCVAMGLPARSTPAEALREALEHVLDVWPAPSPEEFARLHRVLTGHDSCSSRPSDEPEETR